MIEKLGITKAPWKYFSFSNRGVNMVDTHEVHFGDDGECIAEYVCIKEDAQLIASAPEMLEALIRLCDRIEYLGNSLGVRESLSLLKDTSLPIIEKATGKTWEEIKEAIQ